MRHKQHRRALSARTTGRLGSWCIGPTTGHGAATPTQGRRSGHQCILASPQLPLGRSDHRRTAGRAELWEEGHRRRYQRGPQDRSGTTGRSQREQPTRSRLFGDYTADLRGTTGQMEQRADCAGVILRQANDTTTLPFGSGPTRQTDA
jgi:hypothetical protein